jgi:hypothetical protein
MALVVSPFKEYNFNFQLTVPLATGSVNLTLSYFLDVTSSSKRPVHRIYMEGNKRDCKFMSQHIHARPHVSHELFIPWLECRPPTPDSQMDNSFTNNSGQLFLASPNTSKSWSSEEKLYLDQLTLSSLPWVESKVSRIFYRRIDLKARFHNIMSEMRSFESLSLLAFPSIFMLDKSQVCTYPHGCR